MFTGIVTDLGTLQSIDQRDATLRRIRMATRYNPDGIAIGASIACNGICLTVVAKGGIEGDAWFDVDAAAETLARTTLPDWHEGDRINLERALKIGDELGGHIVTGHVDGVADILARDEVTPNGPWGATARFTLRAPPGMAGFIAEKGSVTLDGTSLTINSVARDQFSVLLIPHTMEVTAWGSRRAGDRVNCEIDMMARYAARLAEARAEGY